MDRFIKYNYRSLSQANYIEKVGYICFCIDANISFPDLPVEVADILAKKTDYEKELDKSRKGNHEATAKAKEYRADLDLMLKKNGIYVNFTADGDVAKLESSGFDLADERTYKPKDEISVVATSQPGEVKVFIRRAEGAVAYQVMLVSGEIPSPEKEYLWNRKPMTTRTYQLLTQVKPLEKQFIKYCYVSPGGESAWSTPFEFIITK